MVIFLGPVQNACGIISAAMSTMTVLNKIAAQAGISVCTMMGKVSKAIALARSSVTRNRWWLVTTDKIRWATPLYFSSSLKLMISSWIVSIDISPTVMPEQNAPTQVKTTIRQGYYMRKWGHWSKTAFQYNGGNLSAPNSTHELVLIYAITMVLALAHCC